MALEPTRVAVDFTRQTRGAGGAVVGSPAAVVATPTTGRLTKAAERGYFDLPPSVQAVPDATTGAGVLLLWATTEHDAPWGWRIRIDGVEWRVVTVPSAPSPARSLTVGGASYPAGYLTELTAFTG